MPPQYFDEEDENTLADSSNEFSETANGLKQVFDHGAAMRFTGPKEKVIVNHKIFHPKPAAASGDLFVVGTPPTSDTDYNEQVANQIHDDCSRSQSTDTVSETRNLSHLAQESPKIEAILPSQLVCPKSRYEGYIPPLPITTEICTVDDLLEHVDSRNLSSPSVGNTGRQTSMDEGSFIEFSLSDFSIYLPDNKYHPYEFRPLQDLASKTAHSCFLFDGILSTGNTRRYVQSVPFEICSLGNYGKDIHEVGNSIWIQSKCNARTEIYYRLETPAPEYARFHDTFKWLTDLAKHFVDYCQAESERPVSVHNFREDFSQWVQKTHANSSCFLAWYEKHGNEDFRGTVAANIDFLFKESVGVDDDLRNHPIWGQLKDYDYIPFHEPRILNTIVTPYVYDCFKDLRFGHQLKAVIPVPNALDHCAAQGIHLDLRLNNMPPLPAMEIPIPHTMNSGTYSSTGDTSNQSKAVQRCEAEQLAKIKAIQIGDVLSVTKDGENSI